MSLSISWWVVFKSPLLLIINLAKLDKKSSYLKELISFIISAKPMDKRPKTKAPLLKIASVLFKAIGN